MKLCSFLMADVADAIMIKLKGVDTIFVLFVFIVLGGFESMKSDLKFAGFTYNLGPGSLSFLKL